MTTDRTRNATESPQQLPAEGLHLVAVGPDAAAAAAAHGRQAAAHWLASTHRTPAQARREWAATGMAVLPLGRLFSAVRLPADLVTAVLGGSCPSRALDALISEAFEGPVICDPGSRHYYALVPAAVPRTWRAEADEWRRDNVEVLGSTVVLGVPRLERTEPSSHGHPSYWAVPLSEPGRLCAPLTVARLIAAARHALDLRDLEV